MAGNIDRPSGVHPGAKDYIHHWYEALDQEIGIFIRTDQRTYLMNLLYDARTLAGDPELENLIILQPAEDTLFIAKKATELEV